MTERAAWVAFRIRVRVFLSGCGACGGPALCVDIPGSSKAKSGNGYFTSLAATNSSVPLFSTIGGEKAGMCPSLFETVQRFAGCEPPKHFLEFDLSHS